MPYVVDDYIKNTFVRIQIFNVTELYHYDVTSVSNGRATIRISKSRIKFLSGCAGLALFVDFLFNVHKNYF